MHFASPSSRSLPRAAAVGLALLTLTALAAAQDKSDSTRTRTRARRSAEAPPPAAESALALQLEMAAGDSFYLEIDPHQSLMRLKLAGVALHEYPLLAVERGTPRLAFLSLGQPLHVGGTVWPAGALDPPRPEIRIEVQPPDPNAPDSTLPVFQPPPSIDEMPVPATYCIRYAGGLTLTVTSPTPASAGVKGIAAALRSKLGALREALFTRRSHLRIVLARPDAQHLFRSMPPGTYLLVLPS